VKDTRDRTQLPPLFRRHTRRPRLTGALDEAKAQAILLNAPAGYGKTTLAQEWLQGRDHVAWYRATSASADVAAFSSGLADVVAPIVPGAGDRLKQRLRIGDAPDRAVRPLAELMAEDLAAWPDDGIVVIDDYHLVTDSAAVEEFVDWLLTLVPIRMLVTTRRRPSWASARRVLYGEIVEIGPEQLAMNDEEASQVLGGRPSDAVRALVRQAQGWPALIGLAALSASLELPEERVSDALFRYFAEEVLRSEPPEVQRFMLLASVPPTITGEVAHDVLGFAEPEPLIEHLKGVDILRDEPFGGMCLHPLLRDFLQHKLELEDRELFEHVARRLIEDARAAGAWEAAFELTARLRDPLQAASIVADAASDLLANGRVETLEKWLVWCDSEAHRIPGAVIARAQLLLQQGQIAEAAMIARGVAESLPETDEDAVRAWNLTGRALHLISDDHAAYECHLRARAQANTPPSEKEALWGLFLAANEVEPESSTQYLDELERRVALDIDTRLRLAVGRQAIAEQKASLAGLWPRYEALVPLVSRAKDPMVKSSFLANSAAVNVGRGHYELAHSLATSALTLCTDLRLDFALGVCLSFRSAAEIGLRRFTQAKRTLSQFHSSSSRREDPHFQVDELTLRAKLALAQNRPDEGLSTLEELRFIEAPRRALGEYLGMIAIAHAVVGDYEASLQCANEAQRLTTSVEAVFYSRYALIIADVRRMNAADQSEVGKRMAELVASTAEAEFLDGLVVCYRAEPKVLELLRIYPEAVRATRLAMQLARDHSLARLLGVQLLPDDRRRAVSALTPRELEVLQLMCEGLSNAQIANRLFISESTAKVHVHHILSKLGAKTRLQAVVEAAEILRYEA
jgi:LuxR family maltose regulon positive regulatory protein